MKHKHGGAMMKAKSAPQNTAAGSSSRPGTKGKFPIATSAHPDKKGMGRKVPGALK